MQSSITALSPRDAESLSDCLQVQGATKTGKEGFKELATKMMMHQSFYKLKYLLIHNTNLKMIFLYLYKKCFVFLF